MLLLDSVIFFPVLALYQELCKFLKKILCPVTDCIPANCKITHYHVDTYHFSIGIFVVIRNRLGLPQKFSLVKFLISHLAIEILAARGSLSSTEGTSFLPCAMVVIKHICTPTLNQWNVINILKFYYFLIFIHS